MGGTQGLLVNRYELVLCPATGPYPASGAVEHLADTRLEVRWHEPLFAAVGPPLEAMAYRRCKPRRLPPGVTFRWLGDDGLKERTCDARGNRLTYVPAGELAALASAAGLVEGDWNRAVFAFVAALPPDAPVVLFWR